MTKAEKPDEYHLRLLSWLGVTPRDQGSEAENVLVRQTAKTLPAAGRADVAEEFHDGLPVLPRGRSICVSPYRSAPDQRVLSRSPDSLAIIQRCAVPQEQGDYFCS